jgi:hypothetical protein
MSYNLSELETIANDTDARVEALENGVRAVIDYLNDRYGDSAGDTLERAENMLQRLLETGSVHPAPAAITAASVRIDGSGQPVTVVDDEAFRNWGTPSTRRAYAATTAQSNQWPLHVQPVPGLSPADAARVEAETARSHALAALANRHAYWCLSLTYRGTDPAPCNCRGGR